MRGLVHQSLLVIIKNLVSLSHVDDISYTLTEINKRLCYSPRKQEQSYITERIPCFHIVNSYLLEKPIRYAKQTSFSSRSHPGGDYLCLYVLKSLHLDCTFKSSIKFPVSPFLFTFVPKYPFMFSLICVNLFYSNVSPIVHKGNFLNF